MDLQQLVYGIFWFCLLSFLNQHQSSQNTLSPHARRVAVKRFPAGKSFNVITITKALATSHENSIMYYNLETSCFLSFFIFKKYTVNFSNVSKYITHIHDRIEHDVVRILFQLFNCTTFCCILSMTHSIFILVTQFASNMFLQFVLFCQRIVFTL